MLTGNLGQQPLSVVGRHEFSKQFAFQSQHFFADRIRGGLRKTLDVSNRQARASGYFACQFHGSITGGCSVVQVNQFIDQANPERFPWCA